MESHVPLSGMFSCSDISRSNHQHRPTSCYSHIWPTPQAKYTQLWFLSTNHHDLLNPDVQSRFHKGSAITRIICRGRFLIPGFIRFPPTLAVYDIAHSLLLKVICRDVGLSGLGVTCSPWDARFAGSNPAEVDGFFSRRKNPEHKSTGRDVKLGVPSLRFQAR